jgi:hypothetical protein
VTRVQVRASSEDNSRPFDRGLAQLTARRGSDAVGVLRPIAAGGPDDTQALAAKLKYYQELIEAVDRAIADEAT